jgi:hypothetical protein
VIVPVFQIARFEQICDQSDEPSVVYLFGQDIKQDLMVQPVERTDKLIPHSMIHGMARSMRLK